MLTYWPATNRPIYKPHYPAQHIKLRFNSEQMKVSIQLDSEMTNFGRINHATAPTPQCQIAKKSIFNQLLILLYAFQTKG
jgi:hypothetical protein